MKIINSLGGAPSRGVFGFFKKAVAAAKGVGTARAVMIAQFPWGPVNTLTQFQSASNFRSLFAPDGFDRTGSGYNNAVQLPHADLWLVRVTGASPLKATINLQKTGPANCVQVDAKWPGAAGNGITAVVAPATNGIANSFKLTITKTNASTGRSTVEVYDNVDSTQAAGSYWTNLTAASVLVGPLTKSASGRPADGTYTLASGSDGAAIAASDYVGTPGAGDKGIAVCEKDPNVSFVFCDDVGSGLLATVNAGIAAHVAYMNDRRMGLLTGNPAETDSTAKTNAAFNQAAGLVYCWPHGQMIDEDATSSSSPMITVPLTGAFAALCSILQPHVSPAIKDSDYTEQLAAIKALDMSTTDALLDVLEQNGVLGFQQNSNGTFSPYGSTCTDQSTYVYEFRMKRFIMFSLGVAMEPYRGSPNVDSVQEDQRTIVSKFLKELVENAKKDPLFRPGIVSGGLLAEEAANTTASIAAGDYTVPYQVQLISEMKRIILQGEIGRTVNVLNPVT